MDARQKRPSRRCKRSSNYIPYDRVPKSYARPDGVTDESSQHTLIRFLHDLGIVLNFTDDDRVRDTNVLNPNWVTEGIYALLNNPALQKQHGILRHNQLREPLARRCFPHASNAAFCGR